MRVEIEGDPDVSVARPLGRDLGVNPGLEKMGQVGMSKAVKGNTGHSSGLYDPVEIVVEMLRADRGPIGIGVNQLIHVLAGPKNKPGLTLALPVLFEGINRDRRKCDRSAALGWFRGA